MGISITNDEKRLARQVDLGEYLVATYPDEYVRDGSRVRSIEHDSLIFTRGHGYVWNSQRETGNGIDYLMKYCGCTFIDACARLLRFAGKTPSGGLLDLAQTPAGRLKLPQRFEGSPARTIAYLRGRKIDEFVPRALMQDGLLYEDVHHNMVFYNKDTAYAELHGTLTDKRFKGIAEGSSQDGYWAFGVDIEENAHTFVCESSLDACSLYLLMGRSFRANFISLGGLKPAALARVIQKYGENNLVIAVDNDEAGNTFAAKYPQYIRVPPDNKDWNEDLCSDCSSPILL